MREPAHTALGAAPLEVARTRGEVSLAADLVTLTKARIGVLVVACAFVGGLLGGGPTADLGRVALAALLVGLVAASSGVFNQVLERDVDTRMRRTADRPLPAGRMRTRDAILFGAALGVAGTVGLALLFNVLAALLALATFVAYVVVYTPLKRASTLNTVVGAIPGAMPPVLGYVAIAGVPGPWAWVLFAVVVVWQFPHFLAIAWLYRDDYRRAGMRMLPSMPGAEGLAGRQAFLYSLLLPPIVLLPAGYGHAGPVFTLVALALSLVYVAFAAGFALRESDRRARALLAASLAYLPLLFAGVLFDPAVRLALLPV